MKIPGTNINLSLSRIKNEGKIISAPEKTRIIKKIVAQQMYRVREDIKTWRDALLEAEQVTFPSRLRLYRLYKEIELDLHVTSVVENRKDRTIGKPFKLVNDKNEENEEATKLLNKAWFKEFMSLALDSKLQGFSLCVFGDLIDYNDPLNMRFKEVELMPREHVRPELGFVTEYMNGIEGQRWDEEPFASWWLPVGKKKDLGLYARLAPAYIYKKAAFAAWSEYAEIFGIPPRIGKTNVRDKELRENMEKMLSNMGSAAWGVFDTEDEITIIEAVKKDGTSVFENMIRICDEQMSKGLLGGTMTTDAMGGQYKGDIHENTAKTKGERDNDFIQDVVNDWLMPMLIKHGFPFKGLRFIFDRTEQLTKLEQAEVVKILSKEFDIEPTWVEKTFGVPVTNKLNQAAQPDFKTTPSPKNLLAERYYK